MKKGLLVLVSVSLLVTVVLLSACGAKKVSGQITISGSTALQPMVQQAAEKFMAENKDAQITVNGGGSGTGLSQVSQGQVQIGMSDIFAEEKSGIDATQLKDTKVAVVGFAVVVNKKVTVDSLTRAEVGDIFTGKVVNWKDVGGPDMPVVVVNRPASSGTRATFKKTVMDGKDEVASALTEDSSGQVRKIVGETDGAISYLALSYVDSSLKPLKLDGVPADTSNISTGKYPFWSYEHLYTKGTPDGLTKVFVEYMLSDAVQDDLVAKLGYVPISSMEVQ